MATMGLSFTVQLILGQGEFDSDSVLRGLFFWVKIVRVAAKDTSRCSKPWRLTKSVQKKPRAAVTNCERHVQGDPVNATIFVTVSCSKNVKNKAETRASYSSVN